MNQPRNFDSQSIQHEKVKILRSLKPINLDNINKNTVRGQYCSGFINGKQVPSYLEENGANENSQTETFIAIKVGLKNKQWSGVPFYLRTGKRLAHKYSEIVVFFKKTPRNLFKSSKLELLQNKLIIRLEPNPNIKFDFINKIPGLEQEYNLENSQLKSSNFHQRYSKNLVDAYERLLLESMRGIQSLFVCRDEVEEAWKWIDPIMDGWKNTKNNLIQLYKSGTWGPENSDLLLAHDNRYWYKFN